jgi:glycosyltransferase involved in cell wall biosynthesis
VRVCVDGRSLVGGAGRGVAHYTSALLDALTAAYPDDEYRVVVPRGALARPRAGVVRSALPGRVLYGTAALTGRPRLDRLAGGAHVVWLPAPAPVALSKGVPLVLSVHDRSWEERPRDFTAYERVWHRLARPRALARRARAVLAPTAVVREDLVAAWGLDRERVHTVALAPVVRPAPAPAAPGDEPYFLFVGALEPRKAPDVLARATALARERGLRARVVAVGEGRLPAPGLERAGRVSDAELSALYANALAVVVPSRLEGFGLPAVEALAHGTPVIATDLPVAREVLGDAARFVPVDDAEALAAALLELEDGRRADPAAVAHLSWERTAHATRAALAEAAGR